MNLTVKDVSVFDCFSEAVLLLQPETSHICYLNAPCRDLLEYADTFSEPLMLTQVFSELYAIKTLLSKTLSADVVTIYNTPVATMNDTARHCNVKVSSLSDGFRCCVLTPLQAFSEHPAFQSLSVSPSANDFFHQTSLGAEVALLFRLETKTNTVHYFGDELEQFPLESSSENYPQTILDSGFIYPADHHVFWEFMNHISNGKEIPSVFRMQSTTGELFWHKKEYLLCRDEKGEVTEVIGKIINIQAQKEREEKASRDKLTGCLMKSAFESACAEHLVTHPATKHALMMIDLDQFKAINDNLGHQFGDMVLREVGGKLQKIFRSSDLVGRVGGDEFMVFLKDISDTALLERKAAEVIKALDTTYNGTHHSYRVSGSAGIATYPTDGKDFKTLYNNSDAALYAAKNSGKNIYTFYNDQLSKGTMENTLPFEIASRTLSQYFDSNIVSEVFHLLYESKDIDISTNTVLQIVGRRFAVSRAYIFEHQTDGTYDNTYEWCDDVTSSAIDQLQDVSHEMFSPLFKQANEDGILYSNDLSIMEPLETRIILQEQDIQSFLHAFIGAPQRPSFVMGFDDCATTRVWSPIEISTLMMVSKILAQFLSYSHALQSVTDVLAERTSVLGALNFNAYIIDVDTHRLSYFNQHLQNLIPEIALGDICYKRLRGRDTECEQCPLKKIRTGEATSDRVVIHNELLDNDMLLHAVLLEDFDGVANVFMAAVDVTDLLDKTDAP